MKRFKLFLLISSIAFFVYGQNPEWFYATTDAPSAHSLKTNYPDQIQILDTFNEVSAVYMSRDASMQLKNNGNLHGPGYIFKSNEEAARTAIYNVQEAHLGVLDFTIDQDDFVNQLLTQVDTQNIGDVILDMEAYGTRFNTKPAGIQASHDLKDRWQGMATDVGRTDVTVEAFNHSFTDQISVILTIPGSTYPDEIVIIGGHLDSGDFWLQDNAPGADDNGSGIATLTEVLRILLANDFHPLRTVQFMAYAAEEIGLYGSADIAENYADNNKNVLAVMQLDMTNYNGSAFDIAIISDGAHTSGTLNLFLVDLLEHYNSGGEHPITYDFSYCGYACSDHASWAANGYMASFPFESGFGEHNPYIHSPNDTYAKMGNTAEHSAKFVKLGLEFIVETAKTAQMGTNDIHRPQLMVVVKDRSLIYDLGAVPAGGNSVVVFDPSGKKLVERQQLKSSGNLSLQGLPNGLYIAVFKDKNGKAYSKKFLLK